MRIRRKKMNNSPEIMTEEQVYETVTLEEAADSLDKAENTLILTHVNPDGDCIGSGFRVERYHTRSRKGRVRCKSERYAEETEIPVMSDR